MDLLHLRYFQTVARLEHMTKAAQELRIAQPALSKTIARLEEDLGVPLFDRRSRQIRLNAFGKAYLRKVETALSALEEGRREVADLAGLERGSIRIATTSLSRLSPALGAFRALHPEANFHIVQISPGAADDLVRMIQNGESDLAFTAAPIGKPGIREEAVMRSRIYLSVPWGHRLEGRDAIRLEEAAGEPFIEYKEGHPFRRVNDAYCRQAGLTRNIVCEVEEPEALESLVLAGLGVSFVPDCARGQTSRTARVRIADPDYYRDFTLAWQDGRYLSLAARQFRRFLAEYFAEPQEPVPASG